MADFTELLRTKHLPHLHTGIGVRVRTLDENDVELVADEYAFIYEHERTRDDGQANYSAITQSPQMKYRGSHFTMKKGYTVERLNDSRRYKCIGPPRTDDNGLEWFIELRNLPN